MNKSWRMVLAMTRGGNSTNFCVRLDYNTFSWSNCTAGSLSWNINSSTEMTDEQNDRRNSDVSFYTLVYTRHTDILRLLSFFPYILTPN